MRLPINIEDLLSARTVESDRIEFKEGWNPDAVYRSICAFANDFDNTGCGYILIGVAEDPENKTAIRPVKGLSTAEIASIQQEMIGYNNLIKPYYAPRLLIEEVDGRQILVLWVVAGNQRPYEVPEAITAKHKNWKYFIRKYASSIEAKGVDKEELISLTNNIPFDDRANTQARLADISMMLVKDYLLKVKSKLAEDLGKHNDIEILGQMELVAGPPEHILPKNVGLMMFTEEPQHFFPYTQVEIVYFPKGEAEDFTEYPKITGPVPVQIKQTLDLLKTNFLKEMVIKPRDKAESTRIWNYPLQAIEETLVNAFYHRDYQIREPIEIRIYPGSIIFLNNGGPDRSIQIQAFASGMVRAKRYRNRRLGDFLKELDLTEGRATGIPTIIKVLKDNGSPPPHFNTDDERTFFEVELFCHPAFRQRQPVYLDIDNIVWNLQGIDALLDTLLESTGIMSEAGIARGIAGVQAGVIAETIESIDLQANDIIETIDSAIAGGIAGGIAGNQASTIADLTKIIDIEAFEMVSQLQATLAGNQVSTIAGTIAETLLIQEILVLQNAKQPNDRETLLTKLGVTNQRKNYERFMLPMVERGWLTMTIPGKPTSPNQRYLTTLKGRIVLEFLKYQPKP